MPELIPKSISFNGPNSTFSKLIFSGDVALQRSVGKRSNRKDILLTVVDDNLTRGDNLNEYILPDNDKPAKAIPYKMFTLSSQEEKDITGDINANFDADVGPISMCNPELKFIATPAYIFSEENHRLGVHVENYMFGSLNYLVQGFKKWTVFPFSARKDLVKC